MVKIKETFSIKREPNTPPHTPPESEEVYEVVEMEEEGGYDDPLCASPNNDLGRRLSAGAAALKVSLKMYRDKHLCNLPNS